MTLTVYKIDGFADMVDSFMESSREQNFLGVLVVSDSESVLQRCADGESVGGDAKEVGRDS